VDISVETSKNEEKKRKRKRLKKTEKNIKKLSENYKRCNICINGTARRSRKEQKNYLKK